MAVVTAIRSLLHHESFMERHKRQPEDFTRTRKLPFSTVVRVILQKSTRSLQCVLNETITSLPSAAAFSKARLKLKHTAFIELNERTVVQETYRDTYTTVCGLRLLAVDGSKIILPDTKETRATFGTTRIANQRDYDGTYVCALALVLYDVENKIALDARLNPSMVSELTSMEQHLPSVRKDDLIIFDRGYCAYQTMDSVLHHKAHFLIRCHGRSFKIVDAMLKGDGPNDVTVTLTAPVCTKPRYRKPPHQYTRTVRFIRVILQTGEIEVLATSLLDTKAYPHSIFSDLYYRRWGIETFFSILKSRLNLEHFSGVSVEAIRQDFHAAVFLTGLESILTSDTTTALMKKHTRHRQKVNNAVAFHAIKHRAFDLFMSTLPTEVVLNELTELFLKTPTLYRENKNPPRKATTDRRALNFWKRIRRTVF